jgi:hypothetical protein
VLGPTEDASWALPDALIEADEALHSLYQRVAFSRYLNPLNVVEAREDFMAGAQAPPFAYLRADWAEDAAAMLAGLSPPLSHPMGPMVADAIHGAQLMVLALKNRDEAAFGALNQFCNWRVDSGLLHAAQDQQFSADASPFLWDAQRMLEALQAALVERGMQDWRVELDPVMAARVLVDSAKMVLRVNSRARFRARDSAKLIAHEIDVHARRAENGKRQALRIFETGLPGSLETEEGLALYAEECVQASSPGTAWRQGLVVQAVAWAEELGFRDLYERLAGLGGEGLAWGISLRLKRGLARPGKPGVYAKDMVYFRGLRTVRNWLKAGGNLSHLYVGKVSVDHPVQEWLDAGLIRPGSAPALFEKA